MSTNDTTTENGIAPRTRRACIESMALDRHAGEVGEYDVYSESGAVYRVNLIAGTCDCPDDQHNAPADGCKHYRRVEMETGQRHVPAALATGRTNVARTIDARERVHARKATRKATVATDGGMAIESDQTTDRRPDDCDCSVHFDNGGLGCWPCYRDGFETANPDPNTSDETRDE